MDEYLSYVSSINKLLLKFQWLILFYYGAIFFFFVNGISLRGDEINFY